MCAKRLRCLDHLVPSEYFKIRDVEFEDIEDLLRINFKSNPEVFQPNRLKTLVSNIRLESRVIDPVRVIARISPTGEVDFDCFEGRHRIEAIRVIRFENSAADEELSKTQKEFESAYRAAVETSFEGEYEKYEKKIKKQGTPHPKTVWIKQRTDEYFLAPAANPGVPADALAKLNSLKAKVARNAEHYIRLPVVAKIVPATTGYELDLDALEIGRAKELHKTQHFLDRGAAYKKRKNRINPATGRRYTDNDIAESFGVDRRTVQRAVKAHELPEKLKKYIAENHERVGTSVDHAHPIPVESIHRHVSAYAGALADWFAAERVRRGLEGKVLSTEDQRTLSALRGDMKSPEKAAQIRSKRAEEILQFLIYEAKSGRPSPDCSWLTGKKSKNPKKTLSKPSSEPDKRQILNEFLAAWTKRFSDKNGKPKQITLEQARGIIEEIMLAK